MPRNLDTRPHAAARFAEKARLAQLHLVIVLTEVEEYLQYAGTSSLIDYYHALGAKVLARPIPDFGVPSRELLADVINVATLALADGENVLVHCAGGSGRTGIVVCGVLRNLGVHDTIAWARRQKSTYVSLQFQLLCNYAECWVNYCAYFVPDKTLRMQCHWLQVETEEQRAVVESMPLTITAELVHKYPLLAEVMAAEMGALAVSRARAGSFDSQATIDPSMLDAYQALWEALDADGDGLVEIKAAAFEVEAILAEQADGGHLESPASGGVSVRRLLGAVDLDGDDAISFSEFCLVMSQPLLPPLSEVVIEQHAAVAARSSGGATSTADPVAAAKQLAKTFEAADFETQSNVVDAIGAEVLTAMAAFRMRSRL
eukprot:COSAG02_NODE_5644_length_4157_cov_2.247166_2_plen_374_part_00